MKHFFKLIRRVIKLLPSSYQKKIPLFYLMSVIVLILDIFSVLLLIPLIITLFNKEVKNAYLALNYIDDNKIMFVLVLIIVFLVKNFISIRINQYQAKIAFSLSSNYSRSIIKSYLLDNYDTFKKQKKSTIIKEIIFVANDFVSYIVLSLNTIFSEIFLLIIIMCVGVYFNATVTFIAIITFTIVIYIFNFYNKTALEKINASLSKDYDSNVSNLMNVLNGFMSIKSPNVLNYFLDAFVKSNKTLNSKYAVLHAKRINASKQTEIIIVLLFCCLYLYLSFFADDKTNVIIFLSIFSMLLFKAIPSLNKLNVALTNLKSYSYVIDIMEKKLLKNPINTSENITIHFKKTIQLKSISFQYDNEKPIISNLNFTIHKGHFIGVKGPSGVGKTTLLNIIAKLINPSSGSIYLDDHKITEKNKHAYFEQITYLTQKPFIYEGTILDNLVFNNTTVDEHKIHEILDSLKILNTIRKFPKKLDEYIGVNGNNLSGGELQRLCIARALLQNPEILILDEATNNLDNYNEQIVFKVLKEFAKKNNTTIVFVSHNQDNIDMYDSVINL